MIRFLVTLAVSLVGGEVFTWIHSPVPWLLGPMIFTLIGSRAMTRAKLKPMWPGYLRNSAMIATGYAMGLSFTTQTLREMGRQLPTMVLMTVLLLLLCVLSAFVLSKLARQSFPTMLMGSIPGGLTQMVILAEETPNIDITVITFLQVSRLLMIIFCVPMLVFSPLFGGTHSDVGAAVSSASASWSGLFPDILPYAVVCVAAALLGKKIKFPTTFLLAPMIATAVMHLFNVHGPSLPTGLLDVAQLIIGTYVGLMLRPENLQNKVRTVLIALLSGIILMGVALSLCVLLSYLHDVSASTALLSLAPGGMDQMALMAREVHADLAVISCYQLFRTWFIFFAVPPLMRMALKRLTRPKDAGEQALGES